MAQSQENKAGPGGGRSMQEFPLLQAGKVNSAGDMFTPECLEQIVRDFKPGITVTKNFTGNVGDMEGEIVSLRLIGDTLYATVALFDELPAAQEVLGYFALLGKKTLDDAAKLKAYLQAQTAHEADPDNVPAPGAVRIEHMPSLELAASARVAQDDTEHLPSARLVKRLSIIGASFTTSKVK